MKEIGIEKLIDLLNEYEDGMVSWVKEYVEEFGVFVLNTEQMIEEEIIISKSFGFIKWLVDNDKIDLEKLDKKSERKPMYSFEEEGKIGFKLFGVYESLLMLLSIQDNPIDFLISILKDKKVRTVYVDKDGNVSGDTKRYTDC